MRTANIIPLQQASLKTRLSRLDKQRDLDKVNKTRVKRGLNPFPSVEDIRDDAVSHLKNSGLSFKDIEEKGGPTEHTLSRWEEKKVYRPQLPTLRAALQIIGKDIGIIDYQDPGPKPRRKN
jgi:hypothetical protein